MFMSSILVMKKWLFLFNVEYVELTRRVVKNLHLLLRSNLGKTKKQIRNFSV